MIGLSSEQVNEREAADPRARALAADLDKVDNDLKANQARRTAIVAELEQVGAYGNVFSATLTEEIRNPKPNTPVWANALNALRARRAALTDERRKLETALRGLQQTADKLRRQLAQVGGAGERAFRTAAVTVSCRALPQVTATLSYVVGGASWQPEYDVDVAPRGRGKTGPATRAPDRRRADPPGDRRGLDQRARHAVDRAPEAGVGGAAAGAAGRRRLRAGAPEGAGPVAGAARAARRGRRRRRAGRPAGRDAGRQGQLVRADPAPPGHRGRGRPSRVGPGRRRRDVGVGQAGRHAQARRARLPDRGAQEPGRLPAAGGPRAQLPQRLVRRRLAPAPSGRGRAVRDLAGRRRGAEGRTQDARGQGQERGLPRARPSTSCAAIAPS